MKLVSLDCVATAADDRWANILPTTCKTSPTQMRAIVSHAGIEAGNVRTPPPMSDAPTDFSEVPQREYCDVVTGETSI